MFPHVIISETYTTKPPGRLKTEYKFGFVFINRDEYLKGKAEWKLAYKELSAEIRRHKQWLMPKYCVTMEVLKKKDIHNALHQLQSQANMMMQLVTQGKEQATIQYLKNYSPLGKTGE